MTDPVCENKSFQTVPEQPLETFKWKNGAREKMVLTTHKHLYKTPTTSVLQDYLSLEISQQLADQLV